MKYNQEESNDLKCELGTDLRKICDGILAFITEIVVPSTSIGESKVVYYKMKGVVHSTSCSTQLSD